MDNSQWYEKSMHQLQTDTDKLNILVCRYRNNTYFKDTKMDLKMTEYEKLLAERFYLVSYIDIFFKRCIVLDETTVLNWIKFCRERTFSFL